GAVVQPAPAHGWTCHPALVGLCFGNVVHDGGGCRVVGVRAHTHNPAFVHDHVVVAPVRARRVCFRAHPGASLGSSHFAHPGPELTLRTWRWEHGKDVPGWDEDGLAVTEWWRNMAELRSRRSVLAVPGSNP